MRRSAQHRQRNNRLSFASRKRIALQFLYGINYIHSETTASSRHSLQNVMLKVFGGGAVLVKLSDFGLVKDHGSEFTRTNTEMRGTIETRAEQLQGLSVLNESTHSAGCSPISLPAKRR